MKLEGVENRVLQIEPQQGKSDMRLTYPWPSPADKTAFILTGRDNEESGVISLHWPGESQYDDSIKLKWLRQYSSAQIVEFRKA